MDNKGLEIVENREDLNTMVNVNDKMAVKPMNKNNNTIATTSVVQVQIHHDSDIHVMQDKQQSPGPVSKLFTKEKDMTSHKPIDNKTDSSRKEFCLKHQIVR